VGRQLRLRPGARSDLDAIWSHTHATWSTGPAETYLRGLEAVLELLLEYSEMSRLRPEFSPPTCIHPYRQHVVLYSADDVRLDVLRILHR
jgi:toxin ParE1/3/4